ncbi:MAG: hypothetical protein L0215_14270 [Gemmataceae bacterium]|nr:hypothetical protein [Gemmataceae bacterium]
MPYILDTDHLSILQKGGPEAESLDARLSHYAADEIAATIVSFQEQVRGWLAWINRAK